MLKRCVQEPQVSDEEPAVEATGEGVPDVDLVVVVAMPFRLPAALHEKRPASSGESA
jgi:hypothetical protein